MKYNISTLLWLSATDININLKHKLLKLCGDNIDLFDSLESYRSQICSMESETRFNQLLQARNAFDVDKFKATMKRCDVEAVCIYDERYPICLKEIDNPPIVLYCKGDISLLNKNCLAIVGSRRPSSYGKTVTKVFAQSLAAAGFVIVSGMAYGIDTEAHKAVLEAGYETIAVVATGLDSVYPEANRSLFDNIVKNGLAISEYPIGATARPYNFPERNRIISGISVGVLATEGGLKSGSLITLNNAVEQGRRAFAVPSNIMSKYGAGTNDFLKNLMGAMVTEPNDILKEFNLMLDTSKPAAVAMDMTEKLIYNILSDEDMHFEDILAISGLPCNTLTSVLTSMELKGIIKRHGGNYYEKLNKEAL